MAATIPTGQAAVLDPDDPTNTRTLYPGNATRVSHPSNMIVSMILNTQIIGKIPHYQDFQIFGELVTLKLQSIMKHSMLILTYSYYADANTNKMQRSSATVAAFFPERSDTKASYLPGSF